MMLVDTISEELGDQEAILHGQGTRNWMTTFLLQAL